MRKTLFIAAIAALSAGFTPPSYNDAYTTNGVTYAQLGGVKGSNYVVTAVSIQPPATNYNDLANKPSVNGVSLSGDKTAADLGLQDAIADYTTTGAVRSIVEGYGYATAGSVADVARSATNYTDAVAQRKYDKTGGTLTGGIYFEYNDSQSGEFGFLNLMNNAGGETDGSMVISYSPYGKLFKFIGIDTNGVGNAVDLYANRDGIVALVDDIPTDYLHDDYASLTNSTAFKSAVEQVSPPAEIPAKWALANVTNAQGGAVTAANVGAAGANEVVKLTGDQSIGGSKTFANSAYFNSGLASPSTIAVYGQDSSVRFEVDNIMNGDYVHFGVGDFGVDIGFDYTKRGTSYRVDLPERSGVLSVEGWTSTYRALNEANTNAATRAQLCGAIEKATESKPHFAIIDGEVHIISITP